jgi:hypothetical protein
MDVNGHVGVRAVEDPGPAIDTWSDAAIGLPSQDDLGAVFSEVSGKVGRDVEGEPGLGVSLGRLCSRRVAVFPFPAIPDLLIEKLGSVQFRPLWPGSIPMTLPFSDVDAAVPEA